MFEHSAALPWPATTDNGRARAQALAKFALPASDGALLAMESSGRLLIIGPGAYALEQAETLPDDLLVTVLATDASGDAAARPAISLLRGQPKRVDGSLGDYRVLVQGADGEVDLLKLTGKPFDLILDLGREPVLRTELKPPGYFAPGRDADALHAAVAALPELVGIFEKPRYLEYHTGICAHSERRIAGCTRCLDACPSGAIASVGERVKVDDTRCHGVGNCVAACPTGALQFLMPRVDGELAALRGLLRGYAANAGERPVLLIHDANSGLEWLTEQAAALPEHVLPWQVESVALAGMETWLVNLVYGAAALVIALPTDLPEAARGTIVEHTRYLDSALAGLGYPTGLVRTFAVSETPDAELFAPGGTWPAAAFAAPAEKRQRLRLALDHLWDHASSRPTATEMPSGAPFGDVQVLAAACTLCMSCTSVCPTRALSAGGDTPRLDFTEWLCVQCGMCERACPESAITRSARLLNDPELRRKTRVLYEEAPFDCIRCGKPFATLSTIERMEDKLKNHPMFSTGAALDRLRMCEDCRVKDMFTDPDAAQSIM